MQCIKCGKPVPEGEIFCAMCSLTPKEGKGKRTTVKKSVNTTPPPKISPKSNTKHKKNLADSLNPPKPQRAYGSVERKRPNFFPAFLVALLVAVAAVSYIATTYHEWMGMGDLVEEQAEQLHDAQTEISILEGELATSYEDLTQSQALLQNSEVTLETMQTQLGDTESSVNQTQYDMSTQQLELEESLAENVLLTTQLEEAQAAMDSMATEVENLAGFVEEMAKDYTEMEEAYEFMNQYVVFVSDDGTHTYHLYGCEDLTIDSFWAYNRALAESNGNTACPICFPQ